ncbi:MAG: hypothetical protein JW818_15505 [Pirellulales bacterium]|nr:hypothetical protein [Pirellulales bacterium]
MSFTIYYQSTKPVPADLHEAIDHDVERLCHGRSWLSCEPIGFSEYHPYLSGGVKPNFTPHPEDIAAAKAESLPDGTLLDAIDILVELSKTYGIDWEFSHDYDPGPIGHIRGGVADPDLLRQLEALGEFTEFLSDEMDADFGQSGTGRNDDDLDEDGDDEPPNIIKFPGS